LGKGKRGKATKKNHEWKEEEGKSSKDWSKNQDRLFMISKGRTNHSKIYVSDEHLHWNSCL
jgi:hypothetical protein